ncbi:hypothetical protein Tco_0021894, partial [Tanacetum coccineum]
IIMAQQQYEADVNPDELCPPNKRYDLMDANKKVDLEHFWHTLKEDRSKYRLRFMLDKKELTLTLDDFRQIFHLPQATANNHNAFVPPLSFSDMVPICRALLFASSSNIFDSNIFNSGRHKNKVRMKILDWMITDEMKQMKNYQMYTEVFRIDVPLTQSQPTESTHGTNRTTSASRSPNPDKEVAESSAPRWSTVICLCLPERRSTRLTPPAPVPTIDKADEMMLHDTLQLSFAEHKSREEQEARENVELVDEHLASEEVEKMVEEQENIVDDSS